MSGSDVYAPRTRRQFGASGQRVGRRLLPRQTKTDGSDASLQQLLAVRDSIDAARERIEQQLLQIERARALLS